MSTNKWLKLETLEVNYINGRSLFLYSTLQITSFSFFKTNSNFYSTTFLLWWWRTFVFLIILIQLSLFCLQFSSFFFIIFINCISKFSLLHLICFLFFCLLVVMKDTYPKPSIIFFVFFILNVRCLALKWVPHFLVIFFTWLLSLCSQFLPLYFL